MAKRAVVLKALRAAGPPHCKQKLIVAERDGFFVVVTPEDGKRGTCVYLPPNLSRQTVNSLIRRFGVPRPWFYDELLIPGEEESKKPS